MIHYLFIGLSWLVGALGVGGTVAFIVAIVFLGPTAVLAFVTPLIGAFLRCVKCVAALVFVLAALGSYWVGRHEAAATCRADQLEAELRVKQIDLENAQKAKADETARVQTIEATANDQHAKDEAYIASLESRPACALDGGNSGGVQPRAAGPAKKPAAGARKSDATCTRPGAGIDARCAWKLNTSALNEANKRLSESAAWYGMVRESYGAPK